MIVLLLSITEEQTATRVANQASMILLLFYMHGCIEKV